jgi:hypothetical protein
MATISFDAELMTQQVAAVAVPESNDFYTAWDENGALMIFSLGTNGVFYVFKEDDNGARIMVDLGAALKISPSKVVAFDVTQNPVDSTLYIAAAALPPASDNLTAAQNELYVLKPFPPSMIDVANPDLDLSGLIMPTTGSGAISVSDIYLVGGLIPLVEITDR